MVRSGVYRSMRVRLRSLTTNQGPLACTLYDAPRAPTNAEATTNAVEVAEFWSKLISQNNERNHRHDEEVEVHSKIV